MSARILTKSIKCVAGTCMYAYTQKRTVPLGLSPRALKRRSDYFPSVPFPPLLSCCFDWSFSDKLATITHNHKCTQTKEDNIIKLGIYKMPEIRHAGRDNIWTIFDIQDRRLEYGKYTRWYRIKLKLKLNKNGMTWHDKVWRVLEKVNGWQGRFRREGRENQICMETQYLNLKTLRTWKDGTLHFET
jgi:hypothetical protein